MATVIRDLLVRLGVDGDDQGARNFDQAIAGAKRTMLAAAAAAGTLGAGLFEITRRTANAGDEAAKTATRIGTTAEAVQELSFAADITGSSMAEMETAIRRMTRQVRDAEEGSASAQAAIGQLGVETTDTNGEFRDSVDLFEDFIGEIQQMESDVERAALAQDMFGRSGTRILTMAERQGVSLAELREEFRELGLGMTEAEAQMSEEFNDSLTRMRFLLGNIRNEIGLAFMPAMINAIERVREWALANRAFIDAGIDRGVELIAQAFEKVGDAASVIDDIVQEYTDWNTVITTVASAIAGLGAIKFAPALIAGVKGIIAVIAALLGPLGLKIAAFAALVLVIQDLWVWFQGGESVIGGFIDSVLDGDGAISDFIDSVKEFGAELIDTFQPAFDAAIGAAKSFGSFFASAAELWWTVASLWFGLIADVVVWWWETITRPVLEAIMPIVSAVFTTVFDTISFVFDRIGARLDFLLDLFQGNFDSIGDAWDAFVDLFVGDFEGGAGLIRGTLDRLVGVLRGIIDSVMGWIEQRFDTAFSVIDFVIADNLRAFIDLFEIWIENISEVIGFIRDIFAGEFDSVGEMFEAFADMILGQWERVWDLAVSFFTDRFETVQDVARRIFDWIAERIDATIGRVQDAAGFVGGLIPGVGGDGIASDIAGGARNMVTENISRAANIGDTAIDVFSGEANPRQVAQEVADRQQDVYEERLRQASAAFGGGDL